MTATAVHSIKFPQPIGAVWQHSDKSMFVKINCYREKYIAIKNSKRQRDSEPSFFIHVYKTHTGATPVPFFRDNWSSSKRGSGNAREDEGKESLRKVKLEVTSKTRVQVGTKNVSQDSKRNEGGSQELVGNSGSLPNSKDTRNEAQ